MALFTTHSDIPRRAEVLANIVDPSVANRKLYSAEGTKCIAVTISTGENCSRVPPPTSTSNSSLFHAVLNEQYLFASSWEKLKF